MKNFKIKLAIYAALLTSILALSIPVYALVDSDINSTTKNIVTSGTSADFHIDMKSTAGKNAVGQLDLNRFNVFSGQKVTYGFSNHSQTIVSRVIGGDTSYISGIITSGCSVGVDCGNAAQTGKVILINPAGIAFGEGANIDLNSFTVSTKDINGIKNLKDVTDMKEYQKTLNGLSKNIVFINGLSSGKILLNKTLISANKSIGLVSDNVTYLNSLLKTTDDNSNVKIVTADGVTFAYDDSGKIISSSSSASKSNKTIYIDNSEKNFSNEGIISGDIELTANSSNKESDIRISNATLKGTKLTLSEDGGIYITGTPKVYIDNAKIQSKGDVKISSKEIYADNLSTKGNNVSLIGKNSTFAKNSTITASGEAKIASAGEVSINDSAVKGNNSVAIYSTKKDVNFKNAKITSKNGNLEVKANKSEVSINDGSIITGCETTSVTGKKILVNNSTVNGKDVIVNAIDSLNTDNNAKIKASQNAEVYGKVINLENTALNTKKAIVTGKDTVFINSGTKVSATQNVNINSTNDLLIKNSEVSGKSGLTAKSLSGNTFVNASTLTSKNGNVNVKSDKAMVYVNDKTVINAGKTANIYGDKTQIKNTTVNGKNVRVSANNEVYLYKGSVLNGEDSVKISSKSNLVYATKANINSSNGTVQISAGTEGRVNNSNITSKGNITMKSADGLYVSKTKINGKTKKVDGAKKVSMGF